MTPEGKPSSNSPYLYMGGINHQDMDGLFNSESRNSSGNYNVSAILDPKMHCCFVDGPMRGRALNSSLISISICIYIYIIQGAQIYIYIYIHMFIYIYTCIMYMQPYFSGCCRPILIRQMLPKPLNQLFDLKCMEILNNP